MLIHSPNAKKQSALPGRDRRAQGSAGTLRRLRGLLSRPLAIERRDGRLHLVLVDRRRGDAEDPGPSLAEQCAELRARLVTLDDDQGSDAMRHLIFLHDRLAQEGWSGVQDVPSQVLRNALAQAEALESEEPSPAVSAFLGQLRLRLLVADVREERRASRDEPDPSGYLEVSEATHAEFEASERMWTSSLSPSTLPPPQESLPRAGGAPAEPPPH